MTVYYKLDHSEPGYLSQMLPRADGAWVKRADYEADLATLRAENEQLRNALKNLLRAAKVQNPLAGFPQAEEVLK